MSLTINWSEPACGALAGTWGVAGVAYDSGHDSWVELVFRSPTNVASCFTSTDGGATWTAQNMATARTWRSIAYASTLGTAGRLVAFANGTIEWSDDGGATWNAPVSLPEGNDWRDGVWWPAQGIFVAVAANGVHRVATSTDGKSWTMQTAASALSWSGVKVSATVAVAVTNSSSASTQQVQTSPDGVTWTLQTHASIATNRGSVAGSGTRHGIGYSSDLDMFLITGNDGTHTYAYRSVDDGVTWTASSAIPTITDTTNRGYTWISGAGSWYMACANANYGESTDGDTWTVTPTPNPPVTHSGYTALAWDETSGQFIAGSTLGFNTVEIGAITLASLTGISPATGLSSGGERVTLTGSGFTGKTDGDVTFDGLRATVVTVASDTELSCNTPAHAVGAVDVAVAGCGTLAAAFTYTAAPRLISVLPKQGPTTGGLQVTLTGSGFTGLTAADVTFGGVAVGALTVLSDTALTCTPAAHAAGLVDVAIVAVGSLSKAYRYQATNSSRPTITDTDAVNLPPIPESVPPVDARTGKINDTWLRWWNALKLRVEAVKAVDAGAIISGVFGQDQIPTLSWSKVSKSGSSLADLTTRNANDLTSGQLPQARLPNVLITDYAFADLPAHPSLGMLAIVTDSNTVTWGATIAGGGTDTVLGWYNGTDWTVIGV